MPIDESLRADVQMLEGWLTRKRSAEGALLEQDMWERHGASHASDSEAAERTVHAAALSVGHAECIAALNAEVARLRVERPAVIEAWADARDAVLADFIARSATSESSLAATGLSVAEGERVQWAAVKRGELAFVDENGFYVHADPGAYRAIFGFDL